MLWGPLRTYFVVNYMLLRRWNNEKNVYMNLKMGKRLKQQKKGLLLWNFKKKNSEPISAHLKVKWSIKYDCTGIILKKFFYMQKEYLILIQCCSVFMEDILRISAIEKALWK